MAIDRKEFLKGAGLAAGGVAVGAIGRGLIGGGSGAERARITDPGPVAPLPKEAALPKTAVLDRGQVSYSQAGEDLIVRFFLQFRSIIPVTYLDVGANDPVDLNNTYYFYKQGFRGVLVEPNRTLCARLREVRPNDTVLEAGIGMNAESEADYYIMSHHSWNTFSKEEAEHQVKASGGKIAIREVIRMPLLDINDVMARYFRGAPTFLSIDTEGLDLAILQRIDYQRFRPKIICVETLVSSTTRTRQEIPKFLESQDYEVRGGSFVNTVFVDRRIL